MSLKPKPSKKKSSPKKTSNPKVTPKTFKRKTTQPRGKIQGDLVMWTAEKSAEHNGYKSREFAMAFYPMKTTLLETFGKVSFEDAGWSGQGGQVKVRYDEDPDGSSRVEISPSSTGRYGHSSSYHYPAGRQKYALDNYRSLVDLVKRVKTREGIKEIMDHAVKEVRSGGRKESW